MSMPKHSKKPGKAGNFVRGIKNDGSSTHYTTMRPTDAQLAAGKETNYAARNIIRMNNHDKYEGVAKDIERLLTLNRDLCCYPDCKRKSIMWTPKGKYCDKHREEAILMMKKAKSLRYGI